MKKILMMAFVSMTMLAMASCTKDKENGNDEPETPTLVGTAWECVHSFAVPVLGQATLTMNIAFTTETSCHAKLDLPQSIAALLPTPIDLNGDYDYTFDGKKVLIATNTSVLETIELTYATETMLIFVVPDNLRNLLGTSELVFHKK